WTLMNLYERAMQAGTTRNYDDATLNIPESGDKIPDLLNEARWEIEMLLKFQIKSGSQAGLCYQGANDTELHVLNLVPSDDKLIRRLLNPPTTSATLCLAASAAQASRIFKNIDPSFSEETLKQAEAAWDAAVANPKLYKVDSSYGTIVTDTNDEFYWAACELYSTTGSSKYLEFITNSKHYLKMPVSLNDIGGHSFDGVFDSENTEGFGTITLALGENSLPKDNILKARENIIEAADHFFSIQSKQGYGTTINSNDIGGYIKGYPFESNEYILNIAMVSAYAFDFTNNDKYINSALESMDYILGRNPNQQCYVTRFGTRPLQNPHHLSFAYQDDNSLPKPPPGFVSGGPATTLSRSWVTTPEYNPGEMPPQKNFADSFDSWWTNGVNINLNASFAWVAGYINEIRSEPPPPPPTPTPLPYSGDLNDDMKINSTDASILKRVILDSFTGYYNKDNADINCDGKINSFDYVLLKRKILAGS
ncbi:MAG TPA: glycoside hydrolase family 9 protein, partial [Clostridia bacterium]